MTDGRERRRYATYQRALGDARHTRARAGQRDRRQVQARPAHRVAEVADERVRVRVLEGARRADPGAAHGRDGREGRRRGERGFSPRSTRCARRRPSCRRSPARRRRWRDRRSVRGLGGGAIAGGGGGQPLAAACVRARAPTDMPARDSRSGRRRGALEQGVLGAERAGRLRLDPRVLFPEPRDLGVARGLGPAESRPAALRRRPDLLLAQARRAPRRSARRAARAAAPRRARGGRAGRRAAPRGPVVRRGAGPARAESGGSAARRGRAASPRAGAASLLLLPHRARAPTERPAVSAGGGRRRDRCLIGRRRRHGRCRCLIGHRRGSGGSSCSRRRRAVSPPRTGRARRRPEETTAPPAAVPRRRRPARDAARPRPDREARHVGRRRGDRGRRDRRRRRLRGGRLLPRSAPARPRTGRHRPDGAGGRAPARRAAPPASAPGRRRTNRPASVDRKASAAASAGPRRRRATPTRRALAAAPRPRSQDRSRRARGRGGARNRGRGRRRLSFLLAHAFLLLVAAPGGGGGVGALGLGLGLPARRGRLSSDFFAGRGDGVFWATRTPNAAWPSRIVTSRIAPGGDGSTGVASSTTTAGFFFRFAPRVVVEEQMRE